MNQGRISQVLGAVFDVEFEPGKQPAIYKPLKLTNRTIDDRQDDSVAED